MFEPFFFTIKMIHFYGEKKEHFISLFRIRTITLNREPIPAWQSMMESDTSSDEINSDNSNMRFWLQI